MRVSAEPIGEIDHSELHSFAGDPDQSLYLLLSSRRDKSCQTVHCFTEYGTWEQTIEGDGTPYDFAQPLPEGLLLAHARQWGTRPNARVHDSNGRILREFCLGDGIEELQTTQSGAIWASYFDEGVFGNTIASAGLIRFDSFGNVEFKFQPRGGMDWITDCYALNVESNDSTWFYYYTPFPLVRLRHDAVDAVWQPGLRGAQVFAVFGNRALMHSGYTTKLTGHSSN
ncbi:MAG: hypothetical protein U0Q16_30575 [Bryobacteraceae bacterium]